MSGLGRVPSYAPGAPSGPGLFIRLAHPPAVAARLLADASGAADARPADGPRPLRRRLVLALLALAVAALVIDVVAGFNSAVFMGVFVPLALAGIPVVLALTIPPGAGLLATLGRKLVSRLAVVVLFVLLIGFGGALMGAAVGAKAGWWIGLASILAFVVLVFGLAGGTPSTLRPTGRQKDRLEAARHVLETLADDVAPGKAVTGWVDLTGPEQKTKLFARGTAASGAKVEVFRDEWLHLAGPLRDGTRLRVAAVSRQKVKLARWVTRGGKTKRKPRALAQTLSTIEVRARVDPRLYHPRPPAAAGTRLGRVTVSSIEATAEAVSGVFVPSDESRPEDILDAVAAVFGHLERATPPVQP
jgi:hypothetical protein